MAVQSHFELSKENIAQWTWGFSVPARALRVIATSPRLILLSIIPSLITLAITVYFFSTARTWAAGQIQTWVSYLGLSVDGWAFNLAFIGINVIVILGALILFSMLATVIATPFSDFLAEQTEPLTTPKLDLAPKRSFLQLLGLLWIDVVKSIFIIFISIPLLLMSWIPGLNIIAYLAFSLLLAYQYLGYPQTRRGIALRESLQFIKANLFLTLGFGMSISIGYMIPFGGFIILPIAVVSGTLVYAYGSRKPNGASKPPL